MADIIVDVSLPSPITTDVTSPTQALATNISVPGPQGPTGPRGFTPLINGITGQSILFSGKDGIIISADQSINTIYISGNSGYFEGKINSLTTNLESTGNNLYNLLINFSGNLDANYATDLQLYNTGSTLDNKINSLSGWSASAINLQQTGENLYSLLINFSGNLDANYASDAQLFTTGSTLDTKINSLSGYVDIQDNSILLNLNSTGSILDNRINSLSGYSASIVNLASTGSTLDSKINSLSGYSASINNLQSTGSNLYSMLIGFSGNLDATYATDSQLATTGSNLDNKINSLSGWSASSTNLANTGSTLDSKINSLSGLFTGYTGSLDATFATDAQLFSTGSTLNTRINNLSGYINSSSSNIIFTTGNQIKSGRLIIGDTIVDASYPYTLSLQSNTPETWLEILNHSGANQGVFFGIDDNNFEQWNSQAGDILFVTSENPMDGIERLRIKNDGKVGIGTSAPSEKLQVIGNIIANNLVYNTGDQIVSGIKTFNIAPFVSGNQLITGDLSLYATKINLETTGATLITNLFNTGSNLNTKINTLSGYTDSQDTTIFNNLRTTGSTLDTKINNLSGYVNTQDNSISNNLITTGTTLNNKINSLSGAAVLKFDDQIIYGTKYFNEDVYIHNLYVTGDEFIANVTNNFVESPYLLLNITGGAIDGGIFFVTGSGLTGINDYGPIIGFDHSNKFKIGVARRSDDLSFLPDIASVQQIEAYSGVANNTFSTITNLALTGSTLNNKINSLSGWSASAANLYTTGSTLDLKINSLSGWSASAVNLASTGSTLDNKINSLSGWSASSINLASTGSTLDNKINSLSGWSASAANLVSTGSTLDLKINSLSGWSASAANLASTGSNLNTRINNLSGYINSSSSNIVFTTGNQTISGTKTFIQDTTFGDSAQGDFLVISGNNFTVYGSGNFTSGLFVNSSPVLTGSSTLYATTVNLASTGSTLDNKINNLSGVSVLRFGDQTVSGVKTFATGVNISGNVGIGTITPFAKLHIAGPPALLNTTMEDVLYLQRPFNAGVAFGSRAVLRLGKYTSDGSQSFTRLDIALRSGSDDTTISTPPEINVMTLRADGRVGIGTTTPNERLTVAGNTNISGNLTVSGSINISGNYDIYSQIEDTKKLAIAYAIAL